MNKHESFKALEDLSRHGKLAMQAGALLCVLALMAAIYMHWSDDSVARPASATPAATSSTTDRQTPPYYLPSQLESTATEPAEPMPTF